MAIQLEEDDYRKIIKDANDNRSLVRIARWITVAIVFLFIFFSFGCNAIQISLTKYRTKVDAENALVEARTNVQIRQIESEGLSTEEYFEWLRVRGK